MTRRTTAAFLTVLFTLIFSTAAEAQFARRVTGDYNFTARGTETFNGETEAFVDRGEFTLTRTRFRGQTNVSRGAFEEFVVVLDTPINNGLRRQRVTGTGTIIYHHRNGTSSRGSLTIACVVKKQSNGVVKLTGSFRIRLTSGPGRGGRSVGSVTARRQ